MEKNTQIKDLFFQWIENVFYVGDDQNSYNIDPWYELWFLKKLIFFNCIFLQGLRAKTI